MKRISPGDISGPRIEVNDTTLIPGPSVQLGETRLEEWPGDVLEIPEEGSRP